MYLLLASTATPAAAQSTAAQSPAPASPSAARSSATNIAALDAGAIYDRTRATIAARVLPPFIAYTQYAAFERHGKVRAQRDRIVIRTSDGKVNDTPLPDSPGDRIASTPVVKDRPMVYPTTTFGLVERRAGEAPSTYESAATPAPAPAASGPPVIGRIVARSREYDPTLIGTEDLAGAPVYHLKLVPRFDPRHHPIRDLYVDTTTFDPRRIVIEVWAQAGPVTTRPTVTVDFAPVQGTWMIAHAAFDFVLRVAFFNYGGSADYHTSDISFPATEPDWMFDPKLLAAHIKAEPAGGK